jgi:hypothetical protein
MNCTKVKAVIFAKFFLFFSLEKILQLSLMGEGAKPQRLSEMIAFFGFIY